MNATTIQRSILPTEMELPGDTTIEENQLKELNSKRLVRKRFLRRQR